MKNCLKKQVNGEKYHAFLGFTWSWSLRAETATIAHPGWAYARQGDFYWISRLLLIACVQGGGEGEGGGRGGHAEREGDQVRMDRGRSYEVHLRLDLLDKIVRNVC